MKHLKLFLLSILLISCDPHQDWTLEDSTDIRRFYGRWTLKDSTDVNIGPFTGLTNTMQVHNWPERERIGMFVYDEHTLTIEVSGSEFEDGIYDVDRLDSYTKQDGSFGGEIILSLGTNTIKFNR